MLLLFAATLMFGSIGDLPLESGQTLRDCKLGYRTYGTLNAAKSNAILFPTWFNGTTEDLEKHIGDHKLVDDRTYYVITVDALANGVSTSPSNSPTQRGKAFPRISMRDMVKAEYLLVTQVLGFDHLHAVMGVSMGGMQTFQWVVSYPDFMTKGVSIVGTPRMSTKDMLLWSGALKGLNLGGLGRFGGGTTGQQAQLQSVVRGDGAPDSSGAAPGGLHLPLNKNPMDALKQFEVMVGHDVSKPYGYSLERAAEVVKAKFMALIALEDKAVSREIPEQFADLLNARKFEMMSPCGHNSYKCEERIISPRIAAFLDEQ